MAILRKKRRQGKKIKLWTGKHRRIKEKGVSEKKEKMAKRNGKGERERKENEKEYGNG